MDSPSSRPSRVLLVSNAVAYVLLIVINALSGAGVLGGTNADISKKFHTPLTPSGWAFAIWGFIFLLQGTGVVYSLMPQGYNTEGSKARVVNAIGYYWQLGWYSEMAWQLFFIRQDVLGMWACAFLLVAGLAAFVMALRKLLPLRDEFATPHNATLLYVSYLLPTTVNAAWLSVASCLGVLVLGRAYGVEEAALLWPSIILAVAVTAAGAWHVLRSRDTAYGLTLVWALLAVYGKKPQLEAMRWVAFAAVAVMCTVTFASLLRRRSASPRASEEREPLTRTLRA